ncbi:MAG: prolyl oligopeptidase family serine peptidase, partial [Pseudomonadota bacterium]
FLQGLEDKIVPPEQTRKMADILDHKKIPHACLYFEHEGHGFKKSDNIVTAILSELWFYSAIFNFTPADKKINLKIKHDDKLFS